ncbi:hypothetical protein Tco_1279651, partial [Tanacetum coccineum]
MSHPGGSGTVAKDPPSVKKITPIVTSEGTSDKPGVPDVTNDDSSKSETESWGNDEDDSNEEQESGDEGSDQEKASDEQESDSEQDDDDNDQENEESDHENESEDDETKSDEGDQGMDDTTDQEREQGNENLATNQEQVVEDAHVTISTIPKKTEEIVSPLDVHVHHEVPRSQAPTLLIISVSVIPESSPVITNIPQSSHTFTPTPIQATPTPPPTIETTNPLSNVPDFASIFQFNDRIIALENDVAELKKDHFHTQVTSLVDSHLDARLGETRAEFMNILSESLTARIKEQVKDQLPQILPQEVSNLAPHVIETMIRELRDKVNLARSSSQPQYTYEAASTLTEFELKKILIDKMEKSESYLPALEHRDCYDGLKKSYALDQELFHSYYVYSLKRIREDKDKDEDPSAGSDRGLKKRKTSKDPEPTTASKRKDSTSGSSKGTKSQPRSSGKMTMQMNQGITFKPLKGTRTNYAELEYDFEECYKALSKKLDWENPEGGDYPFDLSKPLPLVMSGRRQRVPVEYFINNDLKYLQGGVSTMTYTTSTTKTKAAKYDLPGIKDMVPNIWSPVKVAYDQYVLWGISHWRDQRKSFYAYARGKKLRGDVYSTKHILAVTHVEVMRKHGYGYLEAIMVRRADNVLYKFKEGDFLRLQINDIE